MGTQDQFSKATCIDIMFDDRRGAGQKLAALLLPFRDEDPVVLALPRGGVPIAYEIARARAEIRRRQRAYRGGRPPIPVTGRTAIVVDDGLATGGATRAALRHVRRAKPARLVLVVPVAPPDTLSALATEVDGTGCLATPDPFGTVGYCYRDCAQTSDEEVVRLLDAARTPERTART
jgi:putative phosphoribosyl transferase